jgi:hypothetical protein
MRVPIRTPVDETPDITLEELETALAVRHLWQATARCGASFTATRLRANALDEARLKMEIIPPRPRVMRLAFAQWLKSQITHSCLVIMLTHARSVVGQYPNLRRE